MEGDARVFSENCGPIGNDTCFPDVGLGGVADKGVEGGFVISVDDFEFQELPFDVDDPCVHGEQPGGDGRRGQDR